VFGVVEVSAQSYPPLAQELNGTWVSYRKVGDQVFEHQYHWGIGLRCLGNEEIDLNGIPDAVKGCQIVDDSLAYKIVSIVNVGPNTLRVTTLPLGINDQPIESNTIYTLLDHERMTIYQKGVEGTDVNGKTIWYRLTGPGEYLGKLVKIYSPIVKLKQ